jgi:hypothetical protein
VMVGVWLWGVEVELDPPQPANERLRKRQHNKYIVRQHSIPSSSREHATHIMQQPAST